MSEASTGHLLIGLNISHEVSTDKNLSCATGSNPYVQYYQEDQATECHHKLYTLLAFHKELTWTDC